VLLVAGHAGQVDAERADGCLASCSCGWVGGGEALTLAEAAEQLAAHYRENGVDAPRDGHRRGPGSPSALILRRLTRQALERQALRRWGS
jgi:hypothetical protein